MSNQTNAIGLAVSVFALTCFMAAPAHADDDAQVAKDAMWQLMVQHELQQCQNTPDTDYCKQLASLADKYKSLGAVKTVEQSKKLTNDQLSAQAKGAVADIDKTYSQYIADVRAHPPATLSASKDNASAADGHGPSQGSAGTGISFLGQGDSNVSLQTATDTKNASLTWTLNPSAGHLTALSFTAQTPIDADKGFTNLGTLDGLAKSTAIGVQANFAWPLSQMHFGGINAFADPQANSGSRAFQDACEHLYKTFLAAPHDASLDKPDSDFQKINFGGFCYAEKLKSYVDSDKTLPQDVRKALDDSLDDLRFVSAPSPSPLFVLSLNGKVGHDVHSFYDGANLNPGSKTTTPTQLGAAGTYVFSGGHTSLSLSYNYQDSFTDGVKGKMQVLCPPTGSPVLKCVNGFIGAPTATQKDLFTTDLRFIAPGSFPIKFGIDPTFTYDARSGVYGGQLPLYFLTDANHALTGGVRADWTSDEHHVIFGLFVSSAFCIILGKDSCGAASKKDDAGN